MISIRLLIFPVLTAVFSTAQGVSVSAPSYAGKYGAALFGQRYNENTDADRVTLNLGFKKESGQSAGVNMANQGGYGGAGMGQAPGPYGQAPGPYGPNPGPGGGPYGANPAFGGGAFGPQGNPYGPGPGGAGGASYGYGAGGQQAGGQASQYNKLGLDLGVTREKGHKNAQGQQQGVVVGLGRR